MRQPGVPLQHLTLCVLLAALPARAATFAVDDTADVADAAPGDGFCATAGAACTLRAAVQEANAFPGADAITLPAGTYALALVGNSDPMWSDTALQITSDVTITGAGAASTNVEPAGAGLRLFRATAGSLTLVRVTLRQASLANLGSAILANGPSITLTDAVVTANQRTAVWSSGGTVSLTRSTLAGNLAVGGTCGALAVSGGQLVAVDSSFVGNSAGAVAGAVCLTGGAGHLVRGCTFSGNSTFIAGAGALDTAVGVEVVNSTFSGNGGTMVGAINASVLVRLRNVTVTDNTGTAGAGGLRGPATIENTIVAANTGPSPDCSGGVVSAGWNLIGDSAGCAFVTGAGDQVGSTDSPLDPGVDPLAANGGPTQTHALQAGSPALDAGNPAGCSDAGGGPLTDDQRGIARPFGPRCDVGAFEAAPAACGNGVTEVGEQCDDGNAAGGDCCSATCQFEASGDACADDGNLCTDDRCDGAGVCQHPNQPNGTPCIGNGCASGNICVNGSCSGSPIPCPACERCIPFQGCVASPRPSCLHSVAAGKATLLVKNGTTDDGDKIVWKLVKGAATTVADFGAPLAGDDYALCVFDESGMAPVLVATAVAPAGGACAGKPCWKATAKGFRYKDKERTPDGLDGLQLVSGPAGKAKVVVKGKGPALPDPPLPLGLPARVQLQGEHGVCWEASYSAAGVSRNDAAQFKAKGN